MSRQSISIVIKLGIGGGNIPIRSSDDKLGRCIIVLAISQSNVGLDVRIGRGQAKVSLS